MATMARESTGRMQSQGSSPGKEQGNTRPGDGARNARMRRRLILRQGASPLRPPAPFPSGSMFQNGGDLSRVRKPRRNGAPLTDCHRSEDTTEMRERGPTAKRAVGRVVRGGGALRAHEALPHAPPGGKPPETPGIFPLTGSGLLMEAATVRERLPLNTTASAASLSSQAQAAPDGIGRA